MSATDINYLLSLGLTIDEIWCAIAESGPWTLTYLVGASHE